MLKNLLICAAGLVLFSPLCQACDECDKHKDKKVSKEERRAPVVHEVSYEGPRAIEVSDECRRCPGDPCAEEVDNRFNYTKPAIAAQLRRLPDPCACECEVECR